MNNIKYKNEKIIKNDLHYIHRHFYMKFQNLIVKKSYHVSQHDSFQ